MIETAKYKRIVKKYFRNIEKNVLSNLSKQKSTVEKAQIDIFTGSVLDLFKGQERLLEKYLDEIELQSQKDFVKFSEAEYIGATNSLMSASTKQILAIENHAILSTINKATADMITQTTIEQIEKVVFKYRKDYNKLVKNLKGKFSEMSTGRAKVIAKTELGRISSLGRLKGAIAGGVTHKKWQWSGVSRVDHEQMDGQLVPIDSDFVNTDTGNTTQAPRMFGVASEDINCECEVVYLKLEDGEIE